jgi:hypothetical protein
MNTIFPRLRLGANLVLLAALTGCAATGSEGRHASQTTTAGPSGRGGMQGQQGMMMDMLAMCDMHKQQMAGKSPQERQAMMDEHMRSMPPQMRDRMQSMLRQCH